MPFPHLALPTTKIHRALIALMVFLLLCGWVIHVVSLSILQNRAYGTTGDNYEAPPPFFATGFSPSHVYSLDWWFWAYFTFVNMYSLVALASDRTGGIAKSRIPMSVYPAIGAIFCTYRIQDLLWTVPSSAGKALLSAYFIQGIPYFILPLLFGTSFLNTSVDVGHLREEGRVDSGRYTQQTSAV